jgi:branched-chain amino acid transport system permease protein
VNEVIVALVNGLATGMLLFMAAAGLTLIFGVLGILNFAQGGFLALGAFVLYSLTGGRVVTAPVYVAFTLVAFVALGLFGMVLEAVVFKRLRSADPITGLLASFALLLVIQGAIQQFWGVGSLNVQFPRAWRGAISLGPTKLPVYSLVIIIVGALMAVLLFWVFKRTKAGRLIRAVAHDQEMATALGINARVIYALTFAVGAGLGGLGGAFIAPMVGLDSTLAGTLVVESFAVVIVGGLGSMGGALVAALLFGLLNGFVSIFNLTLSGFTLYVGMVVILAIRPTGLGRLAIRRY